MGSVEVFELKGINVLQEAITKILSLRTKNKLHDWSPCTLEIDERGIRLIDHAQENEVFNVFLIETYNFPYFYGYRFYFQKQQNKSLVGRLFNNEQKVIVEKNSENKNCGYFLSNHLSGCCIQVLLSTETCHILWLLLRVNKVSKL